jgi:DNA polymerase-3 subunit epsilon
VVREIILDTETTGLRVEDGHRIIEIGAIEMIDKVLTGKKFHYYLNPFRSIDREAYMVHGISSEFLKNKTPFSDIADEFLTFIADAKLVIHNASFDVKFLNYELSLLQRNDIKMLELSEAIDTLQLARRLFPGARVNLDALCKRYRIDNSSRKLHGALKDAALLAEIYIELTGGRQSRLDIDRSSDENMNLTSSDIKSVRKTKITYPSKEELAVHKDFLSKILVSDW